LKDRIENTARFAGGHHVGIEIIKDLGMHLHGTGKIAAGFHFLLHRLDGRHKLFVFLLFGENLQALHKRHTGIDHDRELAREHGDVLGRRIPAKLDVLPAACLLLFRIQQKDLFATERQSQSLPVIGNTLTRNSFPLTISTFKTEIWHYDLTS
jgi:hypothetical protein